jgi:hypothetical protein
MPAGDIACFGSSPPAWKLSATFEGMSPSYNRVVYGKTFIGASTKVNISPVQPHIEDHSRRASDARPTEKGGASSTKRSCIMSNPEKPYSFLTLLRMYLRGMLDQKSLNTYLLENLVDVAETQGAHGVLMEMMAETIGELDQDIEAIAHYQHLTRPSHAKRADDLPGDQNGSTGSDHTDDSDAAAADSPTE